jgi:hypothetical protein
MAIFRDRRTALALAGAAVALVAGLSVSGFLVLSHRGEQAQPPPASQAGLVIDSAGAGVMRTDPAKPLRCFVNGRLIGEMTIAECAKRNGVATDALDVGVDATGALAAAQGPGPNLAPLPPQADRPAPEIPLVEPPPAATPALQGGPPGACWRFSDNQWRKLPADLALGACVQALFAGRCERAGEAAYGRWSQQTLRLVPGRVEISPDNRSFRPLIDQSQGCPPA